MSLTANLPVPIGMVGSGPPILSVGFAVGACTLFTVSYVGSLYLHPSARIGTPSASASGSGSTTEKDKEGKAVRMDRDHPKVIKARMLVASISTAVSVVATGAVLWFGGALGGNANVGAAAALSGAQDGGAGWLLDTLNIARCLGILLPTPSFLTSNTLPFDPSLTSYLLWMARQAVVPLGLTASLFLGPLYVSFLEQELPLQTNFNFQRDVVHKFTCLQGLRNFLVGPITEEVVFRGCILTVLFSAGVSRAHLIFASPLFFGLAHIHHAYNTYLEGGRTREALKRSLIVSTAQFTYTSLFGWYANFLFLRSGSLIPPTVAHVWCNLMGLPNPWLAARWHPDRKWAIWASHVAGIAIFTKLLFPLTSASLLGGSMYWS